MSSEVLVTPEDKARYMQVMADYDEVVALQERIAKLKALAKLKAYKESEDV